MGNKASIGVGGARIVWASVPERTGTDPQADGGVLWGCSRSGWPLRFLSSQLLRVPLTQTSREVAEPDSRQGSCSRLASFRKAADFLLLSNKTTTANCCRPASGPRPRDGRPNDCCPVWASKLFFMASERQVGANRRNALQSTGPRSPEGKAVASRNAVKHGLLASTTLLPDEDPAELEAFAEGLLDDLQPQGAAEELLVERIVSSAWRLRRAGRIETGVLTYEWLALRAECPH